MDNINGARIITMEEAAKPHIAIGLSPTVCVVDGMKFRVCVISMMGGPKDH